MMGWPMVAISGLKVNIEKELIKLLEPWEESGVTFRCIKLAVVDGVGYAAVEETEDSEVRVRIMVIETYVSKLKYSCEFEYKPYLECWCPRFYDCPKEILDLLTPTDNEFGLEWRKRCLETMAKKEEEKLVSALPVGATVVCKYGSFVKTEASGLKEPVWFNVSVLEKRPLKELLDGEHEVIPVL